MRGREVWDLSRLPAHLAQPATSSRELPIISVQRYLPVLGPLVSLPGALAPHLVQVPLRTPHGVRSAKLAQNAGVARGLGSRINGA